MKSRHNTVASPLRIAKPPNFEKMLPFHRAMAYDKMPPTPNPNNAIDIAMKAK